MSLELILVHGNSLSKSTWGLMGPLLEARGARVHAIDLPGHGSGLRLSEDERYSLDLFAEHVARLAASLPSAVLVGHSLGGHVCARVPQMVPNVKGVVLIGSPLLHNAADVTKAFIPVPILSKAYIPDLSPAEAKELAQAYTWSDNPGGDAIANEILTTDARVRAHLGEYLAAGQVANEVAMLGDMSIPVCIAHGQMDPFIRMEYLDAIAAELSAGPVRKLEAAGHSPQLQCPSELSGIVFEFMSRLLHS